LENNSDKHNDIESIFDSRNNAKAGVVVFVVDSICEDPMMWIMIMIIHSRWNLRASSTAE